MSEADYFDDIPDEKIPKDMLDLASHIVKTKAGHFEPSKFLHRADVRSRASMALMRDGEQGAARPPV
jgi:DNA end-binding protein Ku